jgi:membrane protein
MTTARPKRAGHTPAGPLALGTNGWWAVIRRTVAEFRADNISDWAAALTYYAVLSIFPAILALVSVVGLIGSSATQTLIQNLNSFAPGPARDMLSTWLHSLSHSQGSAGVVFVLGLAGSIWAASGYVGAFMRAANVIWDAPEGRPFWKTIPLRVAVTVFAMIVLALGSIAVVVTGPVAQRAGDLLGLGSVAVTVWEIAKWPALLLLLAGLLAVLFYAAPNVRQPGARWVTPGGVFAIVLWLAASGVFAVYVATFGSYNKTYGAVAGMIVFLVWLWISNIAVLLGAELDAELARERGVQAGRPADHEPYLELRDQP